MKLHEKSLLGHRVYGYNTYRGAEAHNYPDNYDVETSPISETKSSVDLLLDSIFSTNPKTKLPDCDIQVFLGKAASPEVRRYIQDNLLADNGGVSDSSKYGSLPDDVIADYARSSDETAYQYRDRIVRLMRENYSQYKKKEKND